MAQQNKTITMTTNLGKTNLSGSTYVIFEMCLGRILTIQLLLVHVQRFPQLTLNFIGDLAFAVHYFFRRRQFLPVSARFQEW